MPIVVRSHVARDFLQNSAYFNTVPKVVWEYVSNSLDNPLGNQAVHCEVKIGGDRLIIEDDGRGMNRNDLERFFTMHGVNVQRAAGGIVRGRFGTGKTAAFGIAGTLRVESISGGLRNVVELRREDINAAKDGHEFAVRELVIDEPSSRLSGTTVVVERLAAKAADVEKTIRFIERRLGRYRGGHFVVVNGHPVEFEEPPSIDERTFALAEGTLVTGSDPVVLTIRVSPTPLDEDSNGVDVLSRGIWHELTLAGLERQEFSQYLFGSVDVPGLEDDSGPIPPFDNTRSGRLNPSNPLVQELYSWMAACLDEVRRDLADRDRERRRSAEARRLQEEADRIATLINRDFAQWQAELGRATGGRSKDLELAGGEHPGEVIPGDGSEASPFVTMGPEHGDGHRGTSPAPDGTQQRPGGGLHPGESIGFPTGGEGERPRRRRGGFSIEYEHATTSEARSRYDSESRTIYINLDHPEVASAKTNGDDAFRFLSHEIAFAEYALAVARHLVQTQGTIFDAQDAIVEVGMTLDRISRLGAFLYTSGMER